MDVRGTYRKIRQVEGTIADEFVVVFSLSTVDGGKEGVLTQVERYMAAKLIVEQRARLATAEESQNFQERLAEKRLLAEEAQTAKVHINVLSEQDLKSIRSALKPAGKG